MNKRKLTHRQQRQVKSNHNKKLSQQYEIDWQDKMLGEPQTGLIITRHAKHCDVEDSTGNIFRCNIRRTITNLVVGDRVFWRQGIEQLQGITGVVEAIQPRKNELTRPDYYDGMKVIAANIDQIIIICSVLPQLSLNIIDRYLVACASLAIPVLIVLNKIDLLSSAEYEEVEKQLSIYQKIGYPTLKISAKTGENMLELQRYLAQGCSILVGQSGVGKSSLINKLLPETSTLIGEISEISGLGQHTTTASHLYHLPTGGQLIDSPGIREFGLWHLSSQQIIEGYREFQPFLGHCKFRDCKHKTDPDCALQQAVACGKISAIRFENYHRLIESQQQTKSQRVFKKEKAI